MADPAVRKVKLELADEPREGNDPAVVAKGRETVGQTMMELCGIVRSREGLTEAGERLAALERSLAAPGLNVAELELFNLLAVAKQMVATAVRREESRGVHLRSDFAERDDAHWRRHSLVHQGPGHGRAGGGDQRGADRQRGPRRGGGKEMIDEASRDLARRALAEDLGGRGDITSEWTVPADLRGRAVISAREEVVVAGLPLAQAVMELVDGSARFSCAVEDGRRSAAEGSWPLSKRRRAAS